MQLQEGAGSRAGQVSISPELAVRRGRDAVAFYERAFGAVQLHRVGGTDEHEAVVAQLAVGGATFWVHDEAPESRLLSPESTGASTVRLMLVVDDPSAVVARAVAHGATELSPVGEEHRWLVGRIEDPFGHVWEVARPPESWPPSHEGER
jgi:PhnB protein